jgi:predicted transcriptional regulator
VRERELDSVLQIIENPIRRRIIKRLSQEPCYALQLSKELGLGQPLVAKHLSLMEKAGIVTGVLESSPNGPERKRYSLAKSISITMDMAPHLFMERATSFNNQLPAKKDAGARGEEEKEEEDEQGAGEAKRVPFGRRIQDALRVPDDRDKLSLISEILNDVDLEFEEVQRKRVELLSVRNTAMTEAARIAGSLRDLDKKRVLFYILEEHDRGVESISQSLNMRELLVKTILEELENELFG